MEINDFSHSSFDDIVFEGRNKGYGAYQHRRLQSRDILIALFLGVFIMSAIIYGPLVYAKYFGAKKKGGPKGSTEASTLVVLAPKRKEESKAIKREVIKVQMEKFVQYKPRIDNEVQEEDPKPDSAYKHIAIGPESQEGEKGEYVDPVGDLGGGGDDIDVDEVFSYVDEYPQYVASLSLMDFIDKNYAMTERIISKGKPGTLYVSFIVEKDGTITSVTVLNGKGLSPEQDAEAVRVLKLTNGNWVPAKINGKPVRCTIRQSFTFAPDQFDY
jgi:protein TonB